MMNTKLPRLTLTNDQVPNLLKRGSTKWFISFLFLLCLSTAAVGQNAAELCIGIRDTLYSSILGEKRPYIIQVPDDYFNSNFQAETYPVLYLLDAEAHFHSISGMVQILSSGVNGTYVIPPIIVVGIVNTNRMRDLTPTHSDRMAGEVNPAFKDSGGGDSFLKFIKVELIPHIEATYRTKPYRILIGHSIGGLLVIHALNSMTETFSSFVSIEPSLWWDSKRELSEVREGFLNSGDLKKKSLIVAQANTLLPENTEASILHYESIKELTTLLEVRNRSGLKWKYNYYEDDSHGSVHFIAIYDALRTIFRGYNSGPLKPPELLRQQYLVFSDETGVPFMPPERVLNSMGIYAMRILKNIDLAQQYFQLNIDYYPRSPNAFSVMGKLWMDKGNKKKSLEFYEKALTLNPNNENVKQIVKDLREQIKK